MWKKRIIKFVLIVLAIGFIVLYSISHFHYSDGTRTGYLSKFSKKGFLFKTYEGELFVGGANADNNTIINNLWAFSVPSDEGDLHRKLTEHEGGVVKLYYYEVLKNMPWQGDTKYFIYKIETVREPQR